MCSYPADPQAISLPVAGSHHGGLQIHKALALWALKGAYFLRHEQICGSLEGFCNHQLDLKSIQKAWVPKKPGLLCTGAYRCLILFAMS